MFYDTYKKLCKDAGTYPSRVAEEIGLSKTVITKWKKGSIPGALTLSKIAQYFNVSMKYLLTGEDSASVVDYGHSVIVSPYPLGDPRWTPNIYPEKTEIALNQTEIELIRLLQQLSQEGQEKALIYIQDLISSGNYRKKAEADTSSA